MSEPTLDLINYVVRSECVDAIIWLIFMSIGIGLIYYSRRMPKQQNTPSHETATEDCVMIFGIVIASIGFLLFVMEGREAAMSLLSPKYYTIETITKWRK